MFFSLSMEIWFCQKELAFKLFIFMYLLFLP